MAQLLMKGLRTKDIANEFDVSVKAIEKHVASLKKKLKVKTLLQLGFELFKYRKYIES